MQFFQLSPQSLWMFFCVATLLTVLTIMGWLWTLHLVKRRTAEAVTDPEKNGAL
jgi:Na+/melibiose symporter-like transporter